MTDNRQSLSDLASLTQQAAQAPAAAPATNGAANGAEGETAAPVQTQPTTPLRQQELDKFGRAYATGRRKDAVARVWLKPGSGKITINVQKRRLEGIGRRPATVPNLHPVVEQVLHRELQRHPLRPIGLRRQLGGIERRIERKEHPRRKAQVGARNIAADPGRRLPQAEDAALHRPHRTADCPLCLEPRPLLHAAHPIAVQRVEHRLPRPQPHLIVQPQSRGNEAVQRRPLPLRRRRGGAAGRRGRRLGRSAQRRPQVDPPLQLALPFEGDVDRPQVRRQQLAIGIAAKPLRKRREQRGASPDDVDPFIGFHVAPTVLTRRRSGARSALPPLVRVTSALVPVAKSKKATLVIVTTGWRRGDLHRRNGGPGQPQIARQQAPVIRHRRYAQRRIGRQRADRAQHAPLPRCDRQIDVGARAPHRPRQAPCGPVAPSQGAVATGAGIVRDQRHPRLPRRQSRHGSRRRRVARQRLRDRSAAAGQPGRDVLHRKAAKRIGAGRDRRLDACQIHALVEHEARQRPVVIAGDGPQPTLHAPLHRTTRVQLQAPARLAQDAGLRQIAIQQHVGAEGRIRVATRHAQHRGGEATRSRPALGVHRQIERCRHRLADRYGLRRVDLDLVVRLQRSIRRHVEPARHIFDRRDETPVAIDPRRTERQRRGAATTIGRGRRALLHGQRPEMRLRDEIDQPYGRRKAEARRLRFGQHFGPLDRLGRQRLHLLIAGDAAPVEQEHGIRAACRRGQRLQLTQDIVDIGAERPQLPGVEDSNRLHIADRRPTWSLAGDDDVARLPLVRLRCGDTRSQHRNASEHTQTAKTRVVHDRFSPQSPAAMLQTAPMSGRQLR
ncbi:hypothetical protein WR25_10252 [Diploscapter pachys]|uniref:30S ribosomal protein S9 n=1 Tax=Diploscapter pachys TaxID=2018661 RepID=A0A2A2K7Z9_9BILA|nr:hypothetical protein WR25_10252 [Diploscapter pachys]